VVAAAKALKGLSLEEGKKVDIKTPNNGDYNSQTSIFINNLNEAVNEAILIEEFS
jgi:predicted DNA-binding antitoxin AbrB/MazE fold protein